MRISRSSASSLSSSSSSPSRASARSSAWSLASLLLLSSSLIACSDDGDGSTNENEVISRITLTFTPAGGGAALTARFDDPDGDGGAAPTVDPVNLVAGATYATTVRFENALETPAEDITLEVADEADQHQIFFTGTAINGPASNQPSAPLTHVYADTDVNGLPIGLASSLTAARGAGQLTVTLRHLPEVNGQAVKASTTATTVRDGGFAGLSGSTDAQVTFAVTVP